MAPKRRRLSDLYVVGKMATVGDGEGSVDVWIQKLNPLEQQNALRRAGAERAKQLAFIEKQDSDEWGAAYAEVVDYADHTSLVNITIRDEMVLARIKAEHEIAAEERWSKDDYITGLVDSWNEDMRARWEADPEDPEAKAVREKLNEFDAEVEKQVQDEHEKLAADYKDVSLSDLRMTATEKLLEQRATTAFVEEFELQQIKYSVREPEKHGEYYFKDREEILGLHGEVRKALTDQYRLVAVDLTEGKDSPGTPGSSTSSEPAEPATKPSSGPEESAQ